MGKEQDLLDGSRSGQYSIVEKILSARIKKGGPLALTSLRRLPGPNTTDPRNGFTCLHYSSLNGHKDIVHLLLDHGANPNIVDHNGSSPLHLASWTGDYEVVNMLTTNANQKADINLKNKDNETALHSACQYGHTAVVSLLLSQGADPFIRNIRSETALDLSAQYGRLETIELLLRMRFDLLKDYLPINREIAQQQHQRHKQCLARHSPLHLASRNGHKAVVKLLLDLGFDVDFLTANGTALHEAVLCGKVEVVRLLLEVGPDLFMENDKGQKVEELLSGLNTSVAKQTKQLIQDHIQSIVHSNRSMISPLSEATTIGASLSMCSQSEDHTLVDSMLNDDIVGMYQHDFEDLMDETDVQCISPPPGYTDIPPPPFIDEQQYIDELEHDHHHHLLDHHDLHHLDVECVSPSSSLFSASIFSELASIFDEHINNRTSADERNSQEFTEDPFGAGLKPSNSFTLSDYRQQNRTSATSDIVAHHQSFDAVYLNEPSKSQQQLMSTSLNSQNNDFVGGKLTKRYQTDSSSREAMQSSNYSLSSSASQDTRSGGGGHKPRPPKPPRKSIERSKAKSLDAARSVMMSCAKSDFNVDYTGESDEDRSVPSQRQDAPDSDHSSPHLNSVISNDKEKLTTTKSKPTTKATTTNKIQQSGNSGGGDNKKIAGGGNHGGGGGVGPGNKSQSITFTQSIDDFYMLYDQVAANSTSAQHQQKESSMITGRHSKHSSSLDNMLQDSVECGVRPSGTITNANPPSPRSAESDIFQTIEPLKQQFQQQIQPPIRRKRKKKQQSPSGEPGAPSSLANTSTNQCQTVDQSGPCRPPRHNSATTTTKRDNWTLTDIPSSPPSEVQNIPAPTSTSTVGTSPRKRSVAVWTVDTKGGENSSLVANRVQVKKKSLADLRRTDASPTKSMMTTGSGASTTAPHNAKSDYFAAYCETLKFDRKGEKGNPFAGLCRGGLTPAKSNPTKVSSDNGNNKQQSTVNAKSSERKAKKTVELSEARKSLRRQRNILSGRAESLGKLNSGGKLSVYQAGGGGGGESTSTGTEDTSAPVPNIYATLRKPKKKCKSLNGDRTPSTFTSTKESSFESSKLGSDNNLLNSKDTTDPQQSSSILNTHQLYLWLKEIRMEQYKDLLISNGYDNLNFMDVNVMDDSDLLEIGIINASHREVILKAAQRLQKCTPKLTKTEIKTISVSEWLSMLKLDVYRDTFQRNGMNELRKVHNIWEVELETMLEIDKSGYRRRIMYSLSDYNRESILMDDDDIASWITDVQSSNDTEKEDANQNGQVKKSWNDWKHARQELVSGCCQYAVRYLGSTLVRELRGIDSTRASMGKLKSAHASITAAQIPKIILSISCQGVQFKDFKSNHLICEHEIRNIHCICQDSEDLNYFAYITKDFESNNHYCHVFMSQQTDLVTEIILTLGQAFEIAYQIVLEQYNIHATAANEMQLTTTQLHHSTSTEPLLIHDNNHAKDKDKRGEDNAVQQAEGTGAPAAPPSAMIESSNGNQSATYSTFVKSMNGKLTANKSGASATAAIAITMVGDSEISSATAAIASNSVKQKDIEACEAVKSAERLEHNHRVEVSTVKYESHHQESGQLSPTATATVDQVQQVKCHDSRDTTTAISPPPPPIANHQSSSLLKEVKIPQLLQQLQQQQQQQQQPENSNNVIISEDIYAVIDKSKKSRKKSIDSDGNSDVSASGNCNSIRKVSTGDISIGEGKGEHRPVPPVRSSSNAGTNPRPEIKPKPPTRVASMHKPEVSPKPKNLSTSTVGGGSTPTPPLTTSFGRGCKSIKPSIAARQAQLISCTSPQPPMTPSPAPSN